MGSLKARQLLVTLAMKLETERLSFSRQEIVNKINEVKYLSAQKKVPHLTLRKEIIHLENKMKSVFTLETKLRRKEKDEKYKVASFKRQITILKKKLDTHEDKELNRRLGKLSHLIGDFLAKHGTEIDVELSQEIMKELHIKEKNKKEPLTKKVKGGKVVEQQVIEQGHKLSPEELSKVQQLQDRLDALRHQLAIHKELEIKNPEQMKFFEEKIALFQDKLDKYYDKYPELAKMEFKVEEPINNVIDSPIPPMNIETEVKHTILLGGPAESAKEEMILGATPNLGAKLNQKLDEELPMPPPPRLTK